MSSSNSGMSLTASSSGGSNTGSNPASTSTLESTSSDESTEGSPTSSKHNTTAAAVPKAQFSGAEPSPSAAAAHMVPPMPPLSHPSYYGHPGGHYAPMEPPPTAHWGYPPPMEPRQPYYPASYYMQPPAGAATPPYSTSHHYSGYTVPTMNPVAGYNYGGYYDVHQGMRGGPRVMSGSYSTHGLHPSGREMSTGSYPPPPGVMEAPPSSPAQPSYYGQQHYNTSGPPMMMYPPPSMPTHHMEHPAHYAPPPMYAVPPPAHDGADPPSRSWLHR